MDKSRRQTVLIATCAFAYIFLWFALAKHDLFNVDETEHLHAAWCMAHGQVLYKDFFEHHAPLWYILINWIPKYFSDPVHALYAGRAFMAVFWAGVLYLQTRLGVPEVDRRRRILSTVFLCSFTTANFRSVEIRPDVPAAFLVSLILVLGQGTLGIVRLVVIGLVTGTALFISPKILFVVSGYLAGLLFYRRHEFNVYKLGGLVFGVAAPIVAILGYERHLNALHDFYQWFLVYNWHLKNPYSWYTLSHGPIVSFIENPIVCGMALWQLFAHGKTPRGWAFAASLFALPFIKAFPFEWYLLLVAPLLSLHAAEACATSLGTDIKEAFVRRPWLAGVITLGLVASFGNAIMGLIMVSNKTELQEFACVTQLTAPSDPIMSVYSGDAFFRPNASFFGWLCPDTQMTLGWAAVDRILLEGVANPQCRGFIWDPALVRTHPRVISYVETHYHYSGCGKLHLRNTREIKSTL